MMRAVMLALALALVACGGGAPAAATAPTTESSAKPRVVVSETVIEILEPITFVDDTEELAPSATPLLEAVASTLRGNPSVKLVEVRVREDDPTLAGVRAIAVVETLVSRGVARDRLRPGTAPADQELHSVVLKVVERD